ncbi:hypothetical protein BH23VER1_BH23VER1_36530 [soil metagenome]
MIFRPLSLAGLVVFALLSPLVSQEADEEEEPAAAPHGSLIEDRAARKLLAAGDLRMEADEPDKALEIWESVIERYPRSRHRFDAHLKLGVHLLESERKFDAARLHFEAASTPANDDDASRAEATLKLGVCHFENRAYGQAFTVLRDLIDSFPASDSVNEAYHFIGLAHFRLGHFSRAIEALEKVGTAFAPGDTRLESVEAGRRLYLKAEDLDLAILPPGATVPLVCRSGAGDVETVECAPLGRNVRLVLGSLPTSLGTPVPGNGILEVLGGDTVEVEYTDAHSADGTLGTRRVATVRVVGTGHPQIMDGAFADAVEGAVLGKAANLQITDADHDRSPKSDRLTATVEILRRKSNTEIEDELASLAASSAAEAEAPDSTDAGAGDDAEAPDSTGAGDGAPGSVEAEPDPGDQIDRYRVVDSLVATLAEAPSGTAGTPGTAIHSGQFRARVPVEMASTGAQGDGTSLQALPGDLLRIRYTDELNLLGRPVERTATATFIEGDLGEIRVTRPEIADRALHLRTNLRTAAALTKIGNHYQDFGLGTRADLKYTEALEVCRALESEAQEIGGSALEETYVQLWRIYFAMEKLDAALSMADRLLREFPLSAFVDEAMLQQAHVVRKLGDPARAISLYGTVVKLRESPLRGEAQFGIAETYEEMALAAPAGQSPALFDRAFTEYQTIYEQFPDSGRIGEAVAKMANFFYQKKDYTRAIGVFESVFDEHPDAAFLDVILFNYGRCLYRLDRRPEARRKFDQLIAEFPESPLASEAKQIADALAKAPDSP